MLDDGQSAKGEIMTTQREKDYAIKRLVK